MISYPVFVITQKNATERQAHISEMFTRLGVEFKFVDGVEGFPGWLGCALAHEKALLAAPAPPFLILEDDAERTGWHDVPPQEPADADLYFLGISKSACFPELGPKGFFDLVLATGHSPGIARLWGMTSAHAVKYCTAAGVQMVLDCIQKAKTRHRPFDVYLSHALPELNCYAPVEPFFQQSAALQSKPRISRVARKCTQQKLPIAFHGERRVGRFQKSRAVCRCSISKDGIP